MNTVSSTVVVKNVIGIIYGGTESGTVMSNFFAHLSRRLTGELIVYPCSGVRPSVRRPSSTISKIFSSETAWPIKAKLQVEHP